MRIGRKALQTKYGISLPVGKFKVNTTPESYEIFSVKDDTEGCILVGETIGKDMVGNSRSAFERLMKKLVAAKSITITVR